MKKAKLTKMYKILSFIGFAILLSTTLVSCGPLMQKPTVSRYNTNAGLVEEPNIINNGERIPHYKTLYFYGRSGL